MKSGNQLLTKEFEFSDPEEVLLILGAQNEHISLFEKELNIKIGLRGNRVILRGNPDYVSLGIRLLEEFTLLIRAGIKITASDIIRGCKLLKQNSHINLSEIFSEVVIVTPRKRLITPKGFAQKHYLDMMRTHDIVFSIGPAGTGKTYLAMAMAVASLLNHRTVKRIILTRPAVEAGEKLGFLPGDLMEKVNPYLRPLYDALHDMMDMDKAHALIQRGQIEVAPLAFMRGRTLNNCFVILDEAQNTTPEQMKMFLTRLGFDSKAVITGDITQIDLPEGKASGLNMAREILKDIKDIAFCYFTEIDVVRHPLVSKIIKAYDEYERKNNR